MNLKTSYALLLMMSCMIAMTFWRVMDAGNYAVHSVQYLNRDSMFKFMQKATVETCKLRWKNKKFDPDFYERGRYNSKQLHINSDSQTKTTGTPGPVNPNPKIRLDPDKFLMVELIGGPNNQVFCLRETIFIAIKMNRTIVIPKFYKHFTDKQALGMSYIYPGHRIDLDAVCSLVSCITQQQFQETCGGKIDAVLALTGIGSGIGKKIEEDTGMKVFGEGNEIEAEIIPNPKNPIRKGKIASTEIAERYHTESRCLVYYNSLFNLLIHSHTVDGKQRLSPALKVLQEGRNTSDADLLRTITKHTQAPKYIWKLAYNFIRFLVKNRPFVAVHWRYNKGDYLRRCEGRLEASKSTARGQTAFCKEVMEFGTEDLARNIEEKISSLPRKIKESGKKKPKATQISDIYIASPPTERETVENVSRILFEKKGWKVHSSIELENYVTSRLKSCVVMKKHLNDIVSTLEMEICSRGFIFLSSQRSTWSGNTRLSRQLCTRDGTHPEYDDHVI